MMYLRLLKITFISLLSFQLLDVFTKEKKTWPPMPKHCFVLPPSVLIRSLPALTHVDTFC